MNYYVISQPSIWTQIADSFITIGQIFMAFGRMLVQIGQFIYEVFFPQVN